jgi:hypothetical protein
MTRGPLSADDIRRLFEELASELDAVGQRAEIFLESPGLLVDVASAEYLLAMKLSYRGKSTVLA